MSNIFDDREKAFEAKYRLDEETAFKVAVRRDKLLGLWTAEQIGLDGPAAQDYAKALVAAYVDQHGDADVIKKVMNDLAAHKVEVSESRLHKELDRLYALAHEQVMEEIRTRPLED